MIDYFQRDMLVSKLGYANYNHYLQSKMWNRIRKRVLERDEYACCVCNGTANQVHHRVYTEDNIFGIKLDGMVSICAGCHRKAEFNGNRKVTLQKANAWIDKTKKKKNPPVKERAEVVIDVSAFQSDFEFLTGPNSPLRMITGADMLSDSEIINWAYGYLRYIQKQTRKRTGAKSS